MDEKLSSLHLDGLVDFSEAEAKFIVLGSTKKHYTVTLSDARQTCQCVDFRFSVPPRLLVSRPRCEEGKCSTPLDLVVLVTYHITRLLRALSK